MATTGSTSPPLGKTGRTPPPVPPPSGTATGGGAGGASGGAGGGGGGGSSSAGTGPEPLPVFGPFMSLQEYRQLEIEIRDGTFDTPVDYQRTVPGVGARGAEDWIVRNLTAATKNMAADNVRLLLGTSVSDVAAALLVALSAARMTKNPQSLIASMVLSVYVGYTVSRDWVMEYAMLPLPHAFKNFEIEGREPTPAKDGATTVKDGWVTTSKMNSTALHLAGHLIVECAFGKTVLERVKSEKGTIFSPPPDSVKTEQADIMRAYSKTLTTQDTEALKMFKEEFVRLNPIVNALFGAGGANVEAALAAAQLVTIDEF